MRIGIDALLIGNRSGTGYYTQKLIESLAAIDDRNEYVIFVPAGSALLRDLPVFTGRPNFTEVYVRCPSSFSRIFWEQAILPRAVRRLGLDVLHFPATIACLNTSVRAVVTIHDLTPFYHPETLTSLNLMYYKFMIPRSIRSSAVKIVDSAATKRDILKLFAGVEDQIVVVPLGVSDEFRPIDDGDVLRRTAEKYGLDQFILSVGTIEPRKNLLRLVEAYSRLAGAGLPHELVLVGRKGWLYRDLFERIRALGLEDRVRFLGQVPQEELPVIYNLADVFVFPSLYEGFGLPPLEAMACGTPVVTSDQSSLPEVVGEAARTVDPTSVDEIARAIGEVLQDECLRGAMVARGFEQAKGFPWRRTAENTLKVYEGLYRGEKVTDIP